MPVKAIAIDDEPLALEIIKNFCDKSPGLDLINCFENALEGLEFINDHHPDLIFLDINMPDITGLELVNSLSFKPMIVFTTAYKEFALEGFELDAVDYLLKPFSFERFEKAAQKAIKNTGAPNEESNLFVFSDYRMVKVPCTEIIYIESLDDYIKINRINAQRPLVTLMTLKKAIEALPDERFARIHRSYIVSLAHVASVSGRKVILNNDVELPMTETYFDALNKKLNIR